MEELLILNSGKTKDGITVLEYAYKDPNEKYKKGYSVRTQFVNIAGLHDKFDSNSFPIECIAEFGYQDTYNGQARKIITKLMDDNGEILFAL